MKKSEQLDEKTAALVAEQNFEERQAQRKAVIRSVKEEMASWRHPQKVKVVSSKKYRGLKS